MIRTYQVMPLILLVACGIPKQNQSVEAPRSQMIEETGVVITQNTAGQDHDLSVMVGDKNIDVSYNDNGFTSFDGYGATLTPDDKEALRKAAEAFAKSNKLSERSTAEDQITYKLLDYLSYAPSHYSFDSNRYEKSFGLKDEGISCIKKNTSVKAEWNTKALGYVSESIVVGTNWPNNYGCMGRCGADCGGWLPSSWTKDCLDHDACSARNNASGGASDVNCGDEFNEAADDWTFGVIRGCGG